MFGLQPRCAVSDQKKSVPPALRTTPPEDNFRRTLALAVRATLSAGLLIAAAATAGVLVQGPASLWGPWLPVLFGTTNTKLVDLRVGPHRFRIPRPYFRHPPHRSGVDDGFYIRALWPGMEPETEETRAAFRASIRTEEGQRRLQVLLRTNQPGTPWPVARWMLSNLSRGPGRAETERADPEAFSPPSSETFGLHGLLSRSNPGATWMHDDLLYGTLGDGRFAAMRCGHDADPDRDRLTSCVLWFDWRQGTWLRVTFIRTQLPKWREIAEAALALVDGWATGDEKADGAGR